MTDATITEEITEADELALEQQFREQEALLAGLNAAPGLDAESLEVAKTALDRQRRLLAAYRRPVHPVSAEASKLALLYEESQLANKELRELLAAFVDPAKRLVGLWDRARAGESIASLDFREPGDGLLNALDKLERSGLVL